MSGIENPLSEMIELAHQYNAKVLVDGAQAMTYHQVDVQALNCDFYASPGYKLCGSTGIGALHAGESLL